MIFIFFLFAFISCHAMEEIKPFPFLKLPPDVQNLILNYVDIHNSNIQWESKAKLAKILNDGNYDQGYNKEGLEKKIHQKFTYFDPFNHSNSYKNNTKYYYFDETSSPLPYTVAGTGHDMYAVSPDKTKVAAFYHHCNSTAYNLFILDLKNKSFFVSSLTGPKNFLNIEAIALSSDASLFAYMMSDYKSNDRFHAITLMNTNTKEENLLKISLPEKFVCFACLWPPHLKFNKQGTQIGVNTCDHKVRVYTVNNNPRMKFLKRLCKEPKESNE